MNTRTLQGPDQRPVASDEWQPQPGSRVHREPIILPPCAPLPDAVPLSARQPGAVRGFTLIEMLVTIAVAGVLSSVALPSFEGQMQRARRADALVSMVQVQAAQERFRSNGASYGSLAAIGVAARSAAGHYTLQMASFDADGFAVSVTANGVQARDTACACMTLTSTGANVAYASGPTPALSNPAGANRACWSL